MHLVNDGRSQTIGVMPSIRTHNLGYPRIGEHRELKKAAELYWKGNLSREALEEPGRKLRRQNWLKQQAAGIDLIPCNDFSFYDQVLDTTGLLGHVPPRFGQHDITSLDTQFLIPAENLWVNPDCGLKTRGWNEVRAALANMVTCAKALRERNTANIH